MNLGEIDNVYKYREQLGKEILDIVRQYSKFPAAQDVMYAAVMAESVTNSNEEQATAAIDALKEKGYIAEEWIDNPAAVAKKQKEAIEALAKNSQ